MANVIYANSSRDIRVILEDRASPDVIELLESTIWGTRGVLYRSRDMEEKLKDLAQPSFLRLVKGDKTVAALVQNHKSVEMAGPRYDAIYLALIAVNRDFARQGFGKILAQASRDYCLEALRSPGLLYGYIESGNEASLRLYRDLGFHSLSEVRPRIFSRARPRSSARVETLPKDAVPEMLSHLKATYHAHSLCNFDESLDPERYFVVRRQGKIVAGAQMHVINWQVLQLPGWQGRLALALLPHIPLLGRNFTPSNIRFARVGNLYAQEGSEQLISEILETALAELRLPLAAMFVDERGEPERRILDRTDLGLLDSAINGGFHLVTFFKGVSAHDLETISRTPVVISPRDPI